MKHFWHEFVLHVKLFPIDAYRERWKDQINAPCVNIMNNRARKPKNEKIDWTTKKSPAERMTLFLKCVFEK